MYLNIAISRSVTTLLAVVLCLTLTACNDNNNGDNPPGNEQATLDVNGGTVAGNNDAIFLDVPAGALLGPTTFSFTPITAIEGLPDDVTLVAGTAYRIEWTGAGFVPNSSVTTRYPHSNAALKPNRGDVQQFSHTGTDPVAFIRVCFNDAPAFVSREELPLYLQFGYVICDGNSAQVGQVTGAAPVITQQPVSATFASNIGGRFSVGATGRAPLSYRWKRNGVDIAGATNASYETGPLTADDNGAVFTVRVSNVFDTITSQPATLTVGPPIDIGARWIMPATEVAPFSAGLNAGLPQIGVIGLSNEFAIWNDNGMLHAKSLVGAYDPIDTLAITARGTPHVVSSPNDRNAFIVFVDDDGTSSCGTSDGNRLSAISVSVGSEGQLVPVSNRITLYTVSTGCIESNWAAGRADGGLYFAVREPSNNAIRVGSVDLRFVRSASEPNGAWIYPSVSTTALPVDAACSGWSIMDPQSSMVGYQEGFWTIDTPATRAVLAFVPVGRRTVCVSTLGSSWSTATPVFTESRGEVSTAIDRNGNVLVADQRIVTAGSVYEVRAAYRSSTGGSWEYQTLDSSANTALPHSAFDASGNVIVAWRTGDTAGGITRIFVSRRAANGTWDATQPVTSADYDTRYPRVSMSSNGQAMVLYQGMNGGLFIVRAVTYSGGVWSDERIVGGSNTNDSRFAETLRYPSGTLVNHYTIWRETNALDSTQFRVMSARRYQ